MNTICICQSNTLISYTKTFQRRLICITFWRTRYVQELIDRLYHKIHNVLLQTFQGLHVPHKKYSNHIYHYLWLGSTDHRVKIWCTEEMTELNDISEDINSPVISMALSKDNVFLLFGKECYLWEEVATKWHVVCELHCLPLWRHDWYYIYVILNYTNKSVGI